MPGHDKQLRYWLAQLQGATPQLELPTDRPRPAVQSYRCENVAVVLHDTLSAQLKGLAQQHEMTLFMVLYAAWSLLLARLSGQEDIVIGTPIAGLRSAQLEGLAGVCVDTLPLRVTVRDDLVLTDFLRQVKEVTLGAYEHRDLPFERIVEALQPECRLDPNCLFQVTLELKSTPRRELGSSELMVHGRSKPVMFDLQLSLEERGEQIVGSLNYATDLFSGQTIERWLACFTVLLQGMTFAETQCRIGELQRQPEAERHQVIELFNQTQAAYPHEKLIHGLFEEQVARAPHATAVVCAAHSLSYAELNCRANQLARHLRNKGVGPDQLVGVCVERSLEMVIGLLGILKAGAAYLPLDPTYPPERLAYMLADAGPKVLLTQERLRLQLPESAAEVVALDSDWAAVALQAADNLDPCSLGLHSRHLAYVIYTSGSTGKPKGVMVTHRNLVSSTIARWSVYGELGRFLLLAPFGFDSSIAGIFGTLTRSGTLLIATVGMIRDVRLLNEAIDLLEVKSMLCVPSLYRAILDLSGVPDVGEESGTLTRVIVAGEACPPRLIADSARCAPERVIFNEYGPTEATVWATVCKCSNQDPLLTVPIGQPIANTQIYILDRSHQPVPIGVAGEIYIGGAGVARGYLNRPELTAERFIADPFKGAAQGRLYRTGDLGRWRPDGAIEYLGRNDQQVKIRGFRIELEEIEIQLARHEQVKEVAVIARDDMSAQRRLVAYVVARQAGGGEAVLSAETLRAYLRAKLPEYMLPSAFVLLEQLPRTANGKLDRRALPAPMAADERLEYQPPRGELEQMLAGVWQEVLHVERIGREDNFFDRGGHSLLATQVLTRMRSWLLIDIPVKVLFDFPVLKELATALNQLVQTHLLDNVATEGSQLEELLSNIASLSEETVQQLVRDIEKGEWP